jgi:hypothetical protein
MTLYFFLRFVLLSVVLVGWILYQLLFKKKKLGDLQGDILAVVCFVCVWVALSYLILD